MSHVPFVRGSARALCFTSLCSLSACGGTAGASQYQAHSADYERSAAIAPRNASQSALPRGEILEREAFVRAVLARNPSIESARQGWRAALARVRQSGAFSDPMVELQLAPLSLSSSKAPLGYEVMVSQAFPWFGKRSLDASVADAEAQAAKSDFEGTKRELALTALTLYDQYFVTYRSLEIHTEHVALMQAIRDAASAQFSSGRKLRAGRVANGLHQCNVLGVNLERAISDEILIVERQRRERELALRALEITFRRLSLGVRHGGIERTLAEPRERLTHHHFVPERRFRRTE